MGPVVTIGLDIAKSVFQVHGVDAEGGVVIRQKLTRARLLKFFGKLDPCLVGIEACGTSHHWARELIELGHDVLCVDSLFTGSKDNILDLLDNKRFEFIRHDICEPLTLEGSSPGSTY